MSTNVSVIDAANAIEAELIDVRRDLRKHPEEGFCEVETSKKIINFLQQHQCDDIVTGILGTGVLCTIHGKNPGPVIALRVDIDALSNCEDLIDKEYASVNPGVCHSCGHDVHTTIGLGVAAILNAFSDKLNGTVKVFFQPSEELPQKKNPDLEYTCFTEPPVGTRAGFLSREAGVLENPKVERLLGIHCWPQFKAGTIAYQFGAAMAGSGNFHISVIGKRGHAAMPHKTVDAIVLAAQVIMGLQTIVSRKVDPSIPIVLTIGAINGGVRRSSIAEVVDLNGTVRCSNTEALCKDVPEAMEAVIKGICIGNGGDYVFDYGVDQLPVMNDPVVVKESAISLEKVLGENAFETRESAMGAEDFSWLSEGTPSLYLKLGTAGETADTQYPLHSPYFNVDESCIRTGVAGLVQTILDFCS